MNMAFLVSSNFNDIETNLPSENKNIYAHVYLDCVTHENFILYHYKYYSSIWTLL